MRVEQQFQRAMHSQNALQSLAKLVYGLQAWCKAANYVNGTADCASIVNILGLLKGLAGLDLCQERAIHFVRP